MKIKVKIAEREKVPVNIKTEYIKLEALLKYVSAVMTGGEAKLVIEDGLVKVDGEKCLQRGKKIRDGMTVTYDGKDYVVSSGAGDK